MVQLYLNVLGLSLAACISVAVVLVFRKLLRKRYSVGWVCCAWLLIAVRLLLPVPNVIDTQGGSWIRQTLDSFHTQEVVHSEDAEYTNQQTQKMDQDQKGDVNDMESTKKSPNEIHNQIVLKTEHEVKEMNGMPVLENSRSMYTIQQLLQKETVKQIVFCSLYLWLFGVIIGSILMVASYVRFRKHLKRSIKDVTLEVYLETLQKVKNEYFIQREIPMFYSREIKSPMLVGVLSPKILIPQIAYSEMEIEVILKHELTHYKHKDIYKKVLLQVISILYWFCPAVYIMKRYANMDLELHCDENVIRNQTVDYKKNYSMTILLTMAEGQANRELSACLSNGKRELKERFSHILSEVKRKKGIGILIAAAMTILIISNICLGQVTKASDYMKPSQSEVIGSENIAANQNVTSVIANQLTPIPTQTEPSIDVTKIQHILLLGLPWKENDEYPNYPDCIMLLTIDWDKQKLELTSITRDLLVHNGEDQLKLAYLYAKDQDHFYKAVEEALEVKMNGVISVNMTGFEDMIDTLGGVQVTLSETEAKYLNTTNYISKKKNRCVQPGTLILNGNQAMGYVRVRHVPTKDGVSNEFGRLLRHQAILTAEYEKLKTMSTKDAVTLLKLVANDIATDLPLETLVQCAQKGFDAKFTLDTESYPATDDFEDAIVNGMHTIKVKGTHSYIYKTLN